MPALIRIGTAGWSIPRPLAEHFPPNGTGLERYAALFTAVEINSTFHRSHREATFVRWADTVPDDFRFAVKMPKRISHELRLLGAAILWNDFGTRFVIWAPNSGHCCCNFRPP